MNRGEYFNRIRKVRKLLSVDGGFLFGGSLEGGQNDKLKCRKYMNIMESKLDIYTYCDMIRVKKES